jgi:hypothetical protein
MQMLKPRTHTSHAEACTKHDEQATIPGFSTALLLQLLQLSHQLRNPNNQIATVHNVALSHIYSAKVLNTT